jgi:hypothetical protein
MELDIPFILQILTLLGIIWGVYNGINKPQQKGELTDAVFAERFTQFDRELANLRDNHLHTLGIKLDKHIEDQKENEMLVCEKLARIETKQDLILKK